MLKLKLNAFAHPQTSQLNKKYIGRIYQKQLLNKVLSCQGRIVNFFRVHEQNSNGTCRGKIAMYMGNTYKIWGELVRQIQWCHLTLA